MTGGESRVVGDVRYKECFIRLDSATLSVFDSLNEFP
jgi:hypothetical protein